MELNIVEEGKNKLLLEVEGEDHTFCNALKNELLNDSHVKVATYNIKHPLVSNPVLIVETDGKSPKSVLEAAAKKLGKLVDKFKKDYSKEIKG